MRKLLTFNLLDDIPVITDSWMEPRYRMFSEHVSKLQV